MSLSVHIYIQAYIFLRMCVVFVLSVLSVHLQLCVTQGCVAGDAVGSFCSGFGCSTRG